jgi:CheY-like chemotaxis protein
MLNRNFKVIITDDDQDDHDLINLAIKEIPRSFEISSMFSSTELFTHLVKKNSNTSLPTDQDVIILDLNMPRLDGFGILEKLKLHPVNRSIPVFILSSSNKSLDYSKAMEMGAHGYYSKTSSFNQLKMILEDVCLKCSDKQLKTSA